MTNEAIQDKYRPQPEYVLGEVLQVGMSTTQIKLDRLAASGTNDREIGVGSYVVIDCINHAVLGQVTEMTLKNAVKKSPSDDTATVLKTIATVSMFANLNYQTGVISSGFLEAPKLLATVYAARNELIQRITTRNYQQPDIESTVQLQLGYLPNTAKTPLYFTPNSFFGRHLAILGTTGSGKSWTLAKVMEEAAKYNSKIILFDASGEFSEMPPQTVHVSVGVDPDPPKYVYPVSVPYYELREMDLFAIFKPNGRSQLPKLKQAIKSLKLAKLAPHLAIDGVIMKAHRSKLDYENEYMQFSSELESPVANFNIQYLTEQIENECVNPQRSPTENDTWGGLNSDDFSDCVPLINRIHDIVQSPNLAPIFNPGKRHSLFTVIRHFLTDDTQRVLRISLQYLSFDYNAREIIANAIGRHLLEIARTGFFRKQPILVAVDEAHQFLNESVQTGEGNTFPLNAFSLIAKEGRKYAINICLSTQRPRDIPEDVLSQMGTMVVHRLINDFDRKIVERASASMDHETANILPILAPGNAVVVGVDFPIPLVLNIAEPEAKPDSKGADYQKYWKTTVTV